MARFTSFVVAVLVASITSTSALCPNCISSQNNCHITAPCSSFGRSLFCGCAPGYKATGVLDNDTSKQWRITKVPGQEYRVWTAPGVVCNTLCRIPFGPNPCGEVAVANQCYVPI
ncbi:hypothetical protein L211DRAFT_262223 [Terfezia boudieri ATCC MYA-4762]|uniref:EGF-like domain-containing protein n=1 Tax=Terfezia boudieri ATCC MYA-4762 TaxID=1051890 RepID=A0A3N4M2F8_9PEZI|nr:hypothetical protein L211DRAFT_262223 [Terfezia boudieri ATCC MYA-4762]